MNITMTIPAAIVVMFLYKIGTALVAALSAALTLS
jgi:hypothetical protein